MSPRFGLAARSYGPDAQVLDVIGACLQMQCMICVGARAHMWPRFGHLGTGAPVARGHVQGVGRVWIHLGLRRGGAFAAVSVWCAAGATMCWLGPRSVIAAKFQATSTTRESIAIAKRKANRAANSPTTDSTQRFILRRYATDEVSLTDLAKEYNVGRSAIHRAILTSADALSIQFWPDLPGPQS